MKTLYYHMQLLWKL